MRIVSDSVYGKVTAAEIVLYPSGKGDFFGMTVVRILAVNTHCRYFNRVRGDQYGHCAVLYSRRYCSEAGKGFLNFIGCCGGGHVPVVRLSAHYRVTDAAADSIGGVTVFFKPVNGFCNIIGTFDIH